MAPMWGSCLSSAPMHSDEERALDAARESFGDSFDSMRWLDGEAAREAERLRTELLEGMDELARWSCARTKITTGEVSPGCRICAEGGWSCLFVTRLCKLRCFYCPDDQTESRPATADGMTFPDMSTYVDCVEHFGVTGVGLSGGEPFLDLDDLA